MPELGVGFGRTGGAMKALAKLLAELVTWRWAPTVGLVSAALLFVMIVVGMVPAEIEVPMANPRFTPKPAATLTNASMDSMPEPVQAAAMPPPARARPFEFGRRGFSPPLERPDAPPPPPPPAPAPEPAPAAPPPPAEEPEAAPPPMRMLANRVGGLLQSVTRVIPGAAPPAPNVPPPPDAPPPPAAAEPPAGDAPAEAPDGTNPAPPNPAGEAATETPAEAE